MKQRRRIYYTEAQKALMWERWRKGESLHAIARLFDRGHSAIQGILAQTGGIRPAPRRRSPLAACADAGGARRGIAGCGRGALAAFDCYQRTSAAVLPEGDRPVGSLPSETQRRRQTAKRTTEENTRLRNTSRTICRMCCVDRLNRQGNGVRERRQVLPSAPLSGNRQDARSLVTSVPSLQENLMIPGPTAGLPAGDRTRVDRFTRPGRGPSRAAASPPPWPSAGSATPPVGAAAIPAGSSCARR